MIVTVLLFALGMGFLYVARATLIAFLFAIFFAYLMGPLVTHLAKPLRGRGRAIAVIYTLLLALVVIFFVVVGPKVTREGGRLGESIPTLLGQLSSGQLARQIGEEHGWSGASTQFAQNFLTSHSQEITQLAQRLGLRIADVAKQAWLLLVVPLLSIFFLKDGRMFSDFLISAIQSRPQREFLENVLNDLNRMLAHFIRAQLILAALSLIVYSIVLWIMGVQYFLVLGMIGGVLEFIPVVGPLAAGLIIISVALLTSYQHWIALLVFLAVWRGMQDYVSSPPSWAKAWNCIPSPRSSESWPEARWPAFWASISPFPSWPRSAFFSAAGASTRKKRSSALSPPIMPSAAPKLAASNYSPGQRFPGFPSCTFVPFVVQVSQTGKAL